jgi:hypothetical protein
MRSLLIGVLTLCATGCCGNLSREAAYHDGVKQYALESKMLDEYEVYVDVDPKIIKPETRKIRKDTAKGLRALIAEEEKALKKN